MNAQELFWTGPQGDAYMERNFVDWWARVPFWSKVMAKAMPYGVLEVGCNAGWNLMAIRACWPQINPFIRGFEINDAAAKAARCAGLLVKNGTFDDLTAWSADLVFTSGVLIHIAPENLRESMQKLATATRRYVLAIEYESDVEQEIEYRGERERLWKRPFGKLYEELGLSPAGYWPNVEGWDRCAAWLMEKR